MNFKSLLSVVQQCLFCTDCRSHFFSLKHLHSISPLCAFLLCLLLLTATLTSQNVKMFLLLFYRSFCVFWHVSDFLLWLMVLHGWHINRQREGFLFFASSVYKTIFKQLDKPKKYLFFYNHQIWLNPRLQSLLVFGLLRWFSEKWCAELFSDYCLKLVQ